MGFEKIGLNLCVGDFLDVFRHFDTNGTGSISMEEFYDTLFQNTQKANPSRTKEFILEGKTIEIKDDLGSEEQGERFEREKIFELLTTMKKYCKLKTIPISSYFKRFEEKNQENIDFIEFLNLLEKMDFMVTRTEAKKIFEFLSEDQENEKDKVKWQIFYDCLTETVDVEAIKKEILGHLEKNQINFKDFFKNYDLNGNGKLNFEEFKHFLNEMIPELNFIDIYELFMEIDKSKDDNISYEEFERFLLTSTRQFFSEYDTNLQSDIKFLMNFLRSSIKKKKMSASIYFEDFLELDQTKILVEDFKKIVKQINSSIKEEEIQILLNYFQEDKGDNNDSYIDFLLFFLFLDCSVDFFAIYHAYYEHKYNSNSEFDYIFLIADADEDLKLSVHEYNNFLKAIQIKDINIKKYNEIFYFLAEKNENYIYKEKLKLYLENFEDTKQMKHNVEKNIIFEGNIDKISFQSIKHDKIACKKYIFFKFSEGLPFLAELHQFIRKTFIDFKTFEDKLYDLFEDFIKNNNILVQKVNYTYNVKLFTFLIN